MQFAFIVLSLALLVSQKIVFGLGALLPRQSAGGLGLGSIPDACQTTCSPITSTVNNCQELSCLCNNDVAKQIADCANCLVAVAGDNASSLQSQEQSVIDQYTNACGTSGEPISSIQVSSVAPTAGSSLTAPSPALSGSATLSSTTSTANPSTTSNGSQNLQTGPGVGLAVFIGMLYALL